MNKPIILIIEDNPTTLKVFRLVLECENFKIIEARDGESALKQLQLVKPDLIIQDLILPDIGCLELNHKIRATTNGSDAPILAVSGFLNKPKDDQYSDGFADFLIKPVENSRLISVVKSFLPNMSPLYKKENNKYRILIVDDNHVHRRILKLHLSYHGFVVDVAEGGHEALLRMKQYRPDVVISDVLMPRMDGFELCIAIRQMAEFSHIPIVLISSQYLEESDRSLANKAGADYYITRTPEVDELISIVNDCIQQKKESPSIFPEAVELFKEEHMHGLIRQLERQIIANTGLAQRCALQLAQLSMLSEIAFLLTDNNGIEKTLENVLSTCLDAAGISSGALYLITSDGNIRLQNMIGYSLEQNEMLENLIKDPWVLSEVLSSKDVIELSSEKSPNPSVDKLLSEGGLTSVLLSPLIAEGHCLGALLLGSTANKINNLDYIAFTRNLSTQIGQSIALAKAIENIYYSEKRYRVLLENASCGIFIFDNQGKVLEVNKQGEKLLNCQKSEIINHDFRNFIVNPNNENGQLAIEDIISDKTNLVSEINIKPADLPERSVEYSGVEVKTENENVIMLMTTDVSERNKLKAQALLNDKLASVGIVAAGVAHEINNPICWVMTNLIFLKNNLAEFKKHMHSIYEISQEPDNNKKLQLLDKISAETKKGQLILEFDDMINESLQGVERVRDIVKDLKSFSRMDGADLASVNVHDILNVAISMASLEFKYRARLEKNYAINLPVILASSGKLNQVFLNLIINAAQAIPEGDINNNVINVSTHIEGENIRIDISDTGQGISAENLTHIFDPFFTTKSPGYGTGLGLPICHEIISHLKGTIEVTSTVNKGTTFSVYLPIHQEAIQSASSEDKLIKTGRKKILIIDDEPYLLKSLMNILKNDFDVTTALGGNAASEIIENKKGKFDAIICDLQMQDMNGADLYSYIRKNYASLTERILFISGGLCSPVLKDFLPTIESCLLEKPFTQDELFNALNKRLLACEQEPA